MCIYCNINEDNYVENIKINKIIDGKKQNFEVFLLDNVESGRYNLFINGDHTEIEIEINYCPICGRKLN